MMTAIRPTSVNSFTTNVPLETLDEWAVGDSIIKDQEYIYDNAIWEALSDHTAVDAPSESSNLWVRRRSTNQFAMLDEEVNTATVSDTGEITMVIQTSRCDSVGFLELDATEIEVSYVVDGVSEFTAQANLVTRESTGSWLGFFTEPLTQQTFYIVQGMVSTAVLDLPRYLQGEIHIKITNTEGPAKCGMCRPGLLMEIGDVENDADTGIENLSIRTPDEFGRLKQQIRNYTKSMSLTINLYTDRLDFVYGWLVRLKDTPLIYIGIEQHSSYIVYGLAEWRISRKGAIMSEMTLDVEGVV